MSDKTTTLDTGASKMLAVQSLLTAGIAWAFYASDGLLAAQAALYGGCIVMFNVWLTNRRMQTAAETAPGNEIIIFYLAAVQRFIFTLGFFILGMGWLELPPVPMVIAFAGAHLGYLFNRQKIRRIK
ncbi:MAG: ATP synthase subunit I [Pseudomonadota bacterium]